MTVESNVRFGGRFYIVENATGKALQSCATRAYAEQTLDILNAHEAKNGRGENYYRLEERGA